jgi:Tol biopolymer transport system component
VFKALSGSLLLLILIPRVIGVGTSDGRMASVTVSPDGKVIAVTFEKDPTLFIYEISMDTGEATRLTGAKDGAESSPVFLAGGKQIAYSYTPGNGEHSRIVIGNADGSGLHPWTTSEADDFQPLFSPDNKTIYFARSGYFGSYSPIAQPHQHDWNFYASALDGTGIRQLTNDHFYMVSEATVSADGRTMIFVSSEEHGDVIEVLSLEDPARPRVLLRPQLPKGLGQNKIYNCPNYMPDGKSILFLAASNGRHGFDYDVYQLDLGSAAVERLTKGNGYATNLRVFADGKRAVFLKWRLDWRGTPVKSELNLLDMESHKVTPFPVSGLN